MKLADVFTLARECDQLVNDVQSSRVPPAKGTGSPAVNEGAGSDQSRDLDRDSAPRA